MIKNLWSVYRQPLRAFATKSKGEQGIIEARLRSDKLKPVPPLVLCGPPCGGKVCSCHAKSIRQC